MLTVGQTGNNGRGGWLNVGHGGSGCEEIAGGAGVKDGPILDGVHVELHGAKQGFSGKSIILGGGQTTWC